MEPSWSLLALISPHFFAFVVSFDFSSIFSRFWRGFGRPKRSKIDILSVLGRIFLDTLFSIDVRVIFEKTDEEKHMKFRLVFNRLFSYMFAEIAVFHNAGILKISDFLVGKSLFLQNLNFRHQCSKVSKMSLKTMGWVGEKASKINEIFMLERDRKSFKIWWFSLPKSRKRERNTLRTTLFCSLVFCNRFWVGLGMVLGGF